MKMCGCAWVCVVGGGVGEERFNVEHEYERFVKEDCHNDRILNRVGLRARHLQEISEAYPPSTEDATIDSEESVFSKYGTHAKVYMSRTNQSISAQGTIAADQLSRTRYRSRKRRQRSPVVRVRG